MSSKNIVVGYRPSVDGLTPLYAGLYFAQRMGTVLHTVHVVDQFDEPINPDSDDWDEQRTEAITSQRSMPQSVLGETSLEWTYQTLYGDPKNLVRKIGDDVDAALFVVGRDPDKGKFRSALMRGRSLSNFLLKETKRPVLIVPSPINDEETKGGFLRLKKRTEE